jgi:hypothetical protein
MSAEDVDEAFREKDHQRQTIRCAIREVLANNNALNHDIKTFLNNLMQVLDNTSLQGTVGGGGTIKQDAEIRMFGTDQGLNFNSNKENFMTIGQSQSYNQVRRPHTATMPSQV